MERPTNYEHSERVLHCERLLCLRKHHGEVKKALAKAYGISPRSVERYLRRARARMVERSERPVEEHRADALAFYESIISDENAEDRDRIKAQAQIDRLLGLAQPERVEHTGAKGGPMSITGSVKVDDFLNAPEYIEFLRGRERHSIPGPVCTNGHQGNGKPLDDGPSRNGH